MINLESPISTINRSCKSDLVAVGGKSFMKVFKLENNEFKLHKGLKMAKTSNRVGTTDMAWNNFLENIIASTTLLNSNVLVWDVVQIGVANSFQKIGSHSQLINRINWSHHNPDLLASCSQDGFIKIWDRNAKSDRPVINMDHKEKIRDCQFSPFNEHYILASYVSGAVKLWDTRVEKYQLKEFIQHETDVLTIDWHPERENIFCSGSMDKNLYIWDTNNSNPVHSYKASHGLSRVKWWKKNPLYIISSYQTNNFYTSMWNMNIDNIPEYLYKGHKDVVTGFCWDMSENRLITCSKDGHVIVNNFSDGYRCIDNLCTNFVKFSDDNSLCVYSDKKPDKLNFELKEKKVKFLNRDKSNKKFFLKSIYASNNIFLSAVNQINNYYFFDKNQIKLIFENYTFISEINYGESNKNNVEKSSLIADIVNKNWKYAKENLKNYNHISVWTQLKFLCELESFNIIDEEEFSNNYSPVNKNNIKMMSEIFKNNIIEIVKFLIDYHADIWLATIIIYMFQNIFSFDKRFVVRIISECFETLRRFKLYNISAKLMKFSLYDDMKHNKQNTLILLSCKKCGLTYDPSISPSSCPSCKTKIKCQIW